MANEKTMAFTVDNINVFAKISETGSIEKVIEKTGFGYEFIINLLHELEEGVGCELVTINGDSVTVKEGFEKFEAWARFIADAQRRSVGIFDIDLFMGKVETQSLV